MKSPILRALLAIDGLIFSTNTIMGIYIYIKYVMPQENR